MENQGRNPWQHTHIGCIILWIHDPSVQGVVLSISQASKVTMLTILAFLSQSCQDYGTGDRSSIKTVHISYNIAATQKVDILFVLDNSSSMFSKQRAIAESIQSFKWLLDDKLGKGNYHVAVITTGMQSPECQLCPPDVPNYKSCINESGESGRFQDRLGHNIGTVENPVFEFKTDPSCRIMDSSNIDRCLYDQDMDRGVIFTGTSGCGYERGFAAVKAALSEPLLHTYNEGFLRDEAELIVIVISDEEDCGEVGDVTEGIQNIGANICYYASNGQDPSGASSDPQGLSYHLTPVQDFYDFLLELKGNRFGYVKFAAIVGMDDRDEPSSTRIEFESTAPNAAPKPSCRAEDCSDDHRCNAYPGTRYIQMIEKFRDNGYADSICNSDFDDPIEKIRDFVSCPNTFYLKEKIFDSDLVSIHINGKNIPRYSCGGLSFEQMQACSRPSDKSCTSGQCVETWTYVPPQDMDYKNPEAPGGLIMFFPHYGPCELISEGDIHLDIIYVTE